MLDQRRFDVLISDIAMPEDDAYNGIRKVRARDAERAGRIPALAPTARIEDRAAAMRKTGLRLLGDNDAREALSTALRLLGHEVHEATDGLGAIEAAVTLRPGVALIDIGLPALDGYEVARRLRKHGQRIYLVALTGYGQPEDRRRAEEAGFDRHVVKLVDPAILDGMLGDVRPFRRSVDRA